MYCVTYRKSEKSAWALPFYVSDWAYQGAKAMFKALESCWGKGNAALEEVEESDEYDRSWLKRDFTKR